MHRIVKRSFLFILFCAYSSVFAQNTPKKEVLSEIDLSMRSMIRMVHSSPDEFSKQWNARREAAEAKLNKAINEEERQTIQWQWASGLINYPYFHHRETGEAIGASWAPRLTAIESIDFNNPQTLKSQSYIELIDAWLHDRGLAILKEKEFSLDDNRWLRAKFRLIDTKVKNAEVKRFFLHRILAEHIDENGAKNTAQEIHTLEKLGTSLKQLKPLKDALTQENTAPYDHSIFTYKQVDGVDLQAHVFSAKGEPNISPAFIWFHGGSWSTGHWSYCPVLCRALQAQGFVVIQVEYRTSQRFDGTPLDALQDAYDVTDWVIQNANKLHINPQQMMVGGFSSGASLASQMAVLNSEKIRAGAYMSGCFDPSSDNWYNRVIGNKADTKKLSPLLMVNTKAPPQIYFHAKDDGMCSYQGALEMTSKLQALNIPHDLISFDQGGHFFVFQSPPARERIKASLIDFTKSLKWLP